MEHSTAARSAQAEEAKNQRAVARVECPADTRVAVMVMKVIQVEDTGPVVVTSWNIPNACA